MTNVRYKLTVDVYMPLDGHWTIIKTSTVFDDLPNINYSAGHVVVLSPGEPATNLGPHNRATTVRNVIRH